MGLCWWVLLRVSVELLASSWAAERRPLRGTIRGPVSTATTSFQNFRGRPRTYTALRKSKTGLAPCIGSHL